MRTFYSLFILLFCASLSMAQEMSCGSYPTKEEIAWERAHPKTYATTIIKKANAKLSITAHIVRDRNGNSPIAESTINSAVDLMNGDFAPIAMEFEVCEFRYIDNWEYYYMHQDSDQAEILVKHFQPNTINIYFCNALEMNGPVQFPCGYAPLGTIPTIPYIFMRNACTSSSVVLSHEMGHFMGLYHTFEQSFGKELADGSNCSTTGDLVCDTRADPDGGIATPFPECDFLQKWTDDNGDWYYPPIGNIMSYYDPSCKCSSTGRIDGGFTPQQYNRMVDMYLANRKPYLW